MICYDCQQDGADGAAGAHHVDGAHDAEGGDGAGGTGGRPVIGFCSRCCLVVCGTHARVIRTVIHQPRGTGKSTGDQPGRRVLCETCYGAERSL
ncbi:hypothetical protein [Streptomyces sp. ODS28]|uniref:hypothetical protein n=1 Tax=Streptomyces sp. ODS28 TaxID=3136688 RepID=UPI0031E79B3A